MNEAVQVDKVKIVACDGKSKAALIVIDSGGTSTRKLKLLVAGGSDPSAPVKKFIARKFRADNIFI